jgi:transposase
MTIDKDLEAKILRFHHVERWGVHTIAAQLGVHHSSVDRVLAQAGLPKIERTARVSILDPYLPMILEKLEEYPTLSAVRLLEMARVRGFTGASSHFRARVAQMRPRKIPEAYLRLRTLPGEQSQMDWAHFDYLQIGRAKRPLMAFVMVLSWSRRIFLRFYLHARTDNFIRGHVEAFEAWGGVSKIVLYDNLKSAVIERDAQAIRFNPQLLELAAHYHFEPRPVAVARGNQKGRVERAIRYIRDNFYAARQWTDLEDLNAQADLWCAGVSSNRRCPQEPEIRVREAFEREKPMLLPLPAVSFPLEERCEVRIPKTPYARFDLNDYSVPHTHVHSTLTLMASINTVRILDADTEVAKHPRSWDKGQQVETEAHIKALVEHKRKAREHRGQNRLRHTVPSSVLLLEQAALRNTPLRSVIRELYQLLDEYGAHEMEHGCVEAIERGVPHSNAVRLALQRRREEQQRPPALAVPLPKDTALRDISVRTATLAAYTRFDAGAKATQANNTTTPEPNSPQSTNPDDSIKNTTD